MPIQYGEDSKGCYARWGEEGHKYRYRCDSMTSKTKAENRAKKQGAAIEARKNKD